MPRSRDAVVQISNDRAPTRQQSNLTSEYRPTPSGYDLSNSKRE